MTHSMCREYVSTETLNNHVFKASRQKIYIKNVVNEADSGCLAVILLWLPYFASTIFHQNPDCYSAIKLLYFFFKCLKKNSTKDGGKVK